jgi:carbon-monoxide dehydrogenase medium subunit
MITTEFDYYSPATVDEALALLRQHGDEAKILAGGHSLIPLMKLRLANPGTIIDIGRVAGLSYIRETDGGVAIGALTTHRMLETSDLLRSRLPIITEAASQIGDVQVRNRGTIGGSLSHADPAADLPAVVLALNGEMRLRGPGGERTVAARDFFVDMLTTALQPNEIMTEVRLPGLPPRTGTAYLKMPNKASFYAVVGIAAVVTLNADGTCQEARIGVTGLAAAPFRAQAAEDALRGRSLDDATVQQAAERVADGVEPLSDIHASADYRAHLARVFTARALRQAAARI